MGQASELSLLRRTDGGLRCNGKGDIKKETPLEKGNEHSTERERERERERELKLIVKRSTLTFNEQPILGLAQERIYIEFVSLLFMLVALVLLSSSL